MVKLVTTLESIPLYTIAEQQTTLIPSNNSLQRTKRQSITGKLSTFNTHPYHF